jgi:hypothetical protein
MIHRGQVNALGCSGGQEKERGWKRRKVRKGWRDKRGAVGSALVVGWIGEFCTHDNWASQPFAEIAERLQRQKRHRSLYICVV